MLDVVIRPAVAADQQAIRKIVRAAGLIPTGLDWTRFLVADEGGRIVGIGQVKPHRDGSRELASIAVIPERQGQGIGTRVIQALLAREAGPLYLLCEGRNETYYARFGFQRLAPRDMPPYFRRLIVGLTIMLRLRAIFVRDGATVIVMQRDVQAREETTL